MDDQKRIITIPFDSFLIAALNRLEILAGDVQSKKCLPEWTNQGMLLYHCWSQVWLRQ
jgi:hypothetical protein